MSILREIQQHIMYAIHTSEQILFVGICCAIGVASYYAMITVAVQIGHYWDKHKGGARR